MSVTLEDQAKSATDPVCGMNVDLAAGKPAFEHAGTMYHFCCQGCGYGVRFGVGHLFWAPHVTV